MTVVAHLTVAKPPSEVINVPVDLFYALDDASYR